MSPLSPVLAALLAAHAPGAAPVPDPAADVVDAIAYPDDAAARAAWTPMAGSPPVSVVARDGVRALRMACPFAGTRIERASWDLAVRLDLATARGVSFRLRCPDASPISGFSLYFRSGDGWYAATFAPASRDGWDMIAIDKEDTTIEGTPAGWGRIDAIRLSAWRGAERDTELFLADVRVTGRDARIAVVRGDSVPRAAPDETESVRIYTQSVTRCLQEAGLAYLVLSDLDVTTAALAGRRIAILPHNPSMPEGAQAALAAFVKGGGRLITFYAIPGTVAAAAGIEAGTHVRETRPGFFASMRFADPRPAGMPAEVPQRSWNIRVARPAPGRGRVAATWHDADGAPTGHAAVLQTDAGFHVTHVLIPEDGAAKRRMLLAMAGHLDASLWGEAARATAGRIGRIGPYADFDAARKAVAEAARGDAATRAALDAAAKRRADAAGLAAASKFPESLAASEDAQRLLLEAYCRAQRPAPGERRAIWCHTPEGAGGLGWDEAVRRLAANGFTDLIPNMLWADAAAYPSDVLPVLPEVRSKGDFLAACLAACRKHGVRCHVWKVNWNCWGKAPKEYVEGLRREGRLQVRFDGSTNGLWLCPSNPANRTVQVDSMVEIARRYAVDGLHFDYIRYPDRDGCFCAGCRERFEAALGTKVARWPQDLRSDPALEARWNDFRREQITAVVAAVSAEARKTRPGIQISAAVFPNWPVDRDAVGQDWKAWCDRGYLDFVCPMNYTPHDATFESLVAQQAAWAGKVPLMPGIGLSCWSPPDDVVRLIDKIAIARRLKTAGFTVFDYSPAATQGVLALCGLGITKRE